MCFDGGPPFKSTILPSKYQIKSKLGTTGQKGVRKTLSSGNGGMILTVRILYLLK